VVWRSTTLNDKRLGLCHSILDTSAHDRGFVLKGCNKTPSSSFQQVIYKTISHSSQPQVIMAPITDNLIKTAMIASRATVAAGPLAMLSRRDLSVNKTQKITLGIIAVYVVVIALLWNIPYIRWVLWPFKVSSSSAPPDLFD
jgi:hypothetical protein